MIVDEGLEILEEDECLRLLGTVALGRVAVTVGALPAIFVVNYTIVDGAVLFRTGEGTKLRAALERAVVAFEADSSDPMYHEGWSVQLIGVAEELAETVDSVPVTPWARGARSHLIRIQPQLVSGRRIVRSLRAD